MQEDFAATALVNPPHVHDTLHDTLRACQTSSKAHQCWASRHIYSADVAQPFTPTFSQHALLLVDHLRVYSSQLLVSRGVRVRTRAQYSNKSQSSCLRLTMQALIQQHGAISGIKPVIWIRLGSVKLWIVAQHLARSKRRVRQHPRTLAIQGGLGIIHVHSHELAVCMHISKTDANAPLSPGDHDLR